MAANAPTSLSTTVDVETPELVVLTYTVAGVGSRAAAALIDYGICFLALIALMVLATWSTPTRSPGAEASSIESSQAWLTTFMILLQFAIQWGYYVLFEALADGRTLGKRVMRLRVVRDGGYSITFGASAVRNLVRLVDQQPFIFYIVGIASVFFSRSGKRLGDLAAGTIVVHEAVTRQVERAPVSAPPVEAEHADTDASAPINTVLTDEEFSLLARYIDRRSALIPAKRDAIAASLGARFDAVLPDGDDGFDARLNRLYLGERVARDRGVAARKTVGAAREKHAIIASGTPRWSRFASRLTDAQRRGLPALGEDGVRQFVSEYRDLSADLARLRTASRGERSEDLFYLSRLVAGAHNLLYRGRTMRFSEIVRFLGNDVPREIRRSAAPILLAAALLFGPAAIAYTAVIQRPDVAYMFIPDAMFDRAEQGIRWSKERKGYIPDHPVLRPVMASSIAANNVQVTFGAFAGGVLLAIPTVLLLVLNGVSIGGIFGLYASKGIGSLILAFVAPHGVLELTAICIAGGAGMLLAAAVLMPGMRTRRRALVENGKRAIRLIAGSTLLLVVAGTIEGFISPIPTWPLAGKLAVSAATAVLLALYLSGGRERRTVMPTGEPTADDTALLALGSAQSAPRDLISR